MNAVSIRWRACAAAVVLAAAFLVSVAGCPEGAGPGAIGQPQAAGPNNTAPGDAGNVGDGNPDDDSGVDPGNDSNGDAGDDQNAGGDDNPGGDQPPDNHEPQVAFTFDPDTLNGAYLMTFLACDGDDDTCNTPNNHTVYLASSNDGVTWTVPDGWEPYQGSVPDVVERGNKLYIYTPREVAIADTTTGDVMEKTVVEIEGDGLPAGFVDPSPILDDEGRIVLFFIAGSLEGTIGTCADGETTCTIDVYSATETDAADGIHFTLDDGARAEVDLDTSTSLKTATDPDIYFDGTQYVLYVSQGMSITVWTSTELTGSYSLVSTLPDGLLTFGDGGVGSGLHDDAGNTYWTYVHADVDGASVIRQCVHADFSTQLTGADFTTVIEAADLGLSEEGRVASPGVWVRQ